MSENLHTLLGPYVLDALDEPERLEFEAHLESCKECRVEASELRETLTVLGSASAIEPPPGLKDRIMAEVARTPQTRPAPPPSAEEAGPSALSSVPTLPTQSRRSLASPVLARVLSVAAAVALLTGGAVLLSTPGELAPTEVVAVSPVATVLDAEDARIHTVKPDTGPAATLVVSRSAGGMVLIADGLRPLPRDKRYQVWLIGDVGPRPAGFADMRGGQAVVYMEGGSVGTSKVGITIEPAAGSERPTSTPVLLATLPL